jgi:hypothetical protein
VRLYSERNTCQCNPKDRNIEICCSLRVFFLVCGSWVRCLAYLFGAFLEAFWRSLFFLLLLLFFCALCLCWGLGCVSLPLISLWAAQVLTFRTALITSSQFLLASPCGFKTSCPHMYNTFYFLPKFLAPSCLSFFSIPWRSVSCSCPCLLLFMHGCSDFACHVPFHRNNERLGFVALIG